MVNSTQWAIKSHWGKRKTLMEKTDIFFLPYFNKYRTNTNQSLISSVFLFCKLPISLICYDTSAIENCLQHREDDGGRGNRYWLQAWFLLPLNTLQEIVMYIWRQGLSKGKCFPRANTVTKGPYCNLCKLQIKRDNNCLQIQLDGFGQMQTTQGHLSGCNLVAWLCILFDTNWSWCTLLQTKWGV